MRSTCPNIHNLNKWPLTVHPGFLVFLSESSGHCIDNRRRLVQVWGSTGYKVQTITWLMFGRFTVSTLDRSSFCRTVRPSSVLLLKVVWVSVFKKLAPGPSDSVCIACREPLCCFFLAKFPTNKLRKGNAISVPGIRASSGNIWCGFLCFPAGWIPQVWSSRFSRCWEEKLGEKHSLPAAFWVPDRTDIGHNRSPLPS